MAVVRDGRFKSQFESGASRGYYSPDTRAEHEHEMFGYPEDLPAEKRPIYGYLSGSSEQQYGGADNYGSVMFRLKDGVNQRTTFTLGDSLANQQMRPVPLTPRGRVGTGGRSAVASPAV
jgi:Protein of unknown function (DUF3626)